MNTKRRIIGDIEEMAVNAIVHQPDEKNAADKHFSDVAKKIVETALQAVDVMEVGNVCRRAVTGAAIQDYDLLAKLLTDKDFDHDRLAKAIEDRLLARASEKPIDFPTYFTPGWLGEIAKWLGRTGVSPVQAGKGGENGQDARSPMNDDELHEAATEEPSALVSAAPRGGIATLPPGADGTPPAAETRQPEVKPVRPQTLDDIGMQMDKRVSRDANGEVVRIHFAGIRHVTGFKPAQLWEIVVAKSINTDGSKYSNIAVKRDHEDVFRGVAFFGLESAGDIAISMMIRKIIGDTAKKYRDHFRKISNATAMSKAAQAGEVA